MNIIIKLSLALSLCIGLNMTAAAQCDTIADLCAKNIPTNYISDGQSYRAFLTDEQVAEFRITLFAGADYRIAACSGFDPTNVVFRVLDQKRNVLFTNEDYDLISFWNFSTENTMDCIIEAELNSDVVESGCAVILISFAR
jgi:hypothetical protein